MIQYKKPKNVKKNIKTSKTSKKTYKQNIAGPAILLNIFIQCPNDNRFLQQPKSVAYTAIQATGKDDHDYANVEVADDVRNDKDNQLFKEFIF